MIKTDVHTQFNFDSLKLFRRGKVRDVFDFGENLLIVSSDRVSAFDNVIERGIPNKGQVLTKSGLFEGFGTLTKPEGSFYEGWWKHGKK